MEKMEQNEQEINLGEILGLLRKKIVIITTSALLLGVATFVVSEFLLTPEYKSTTKMYVLTKTNTNRNITNEEINISSQVTKDYIEIIKSRTVCDKVMKEFGINMEYKDFLKKIEVKPTDETRIVTVSALDPDPKLAKNIANSMRYTSAKRIMDVMDIDSVNVIDLAEEPKKQFTPNVMKNTLIGSIIGALAAIFIILIKFITDKNIKTSEDVEKYLKISTLGAIPIYGKNGNEGHNVIEAYKALRTNVKFCGMDKKVIAVTSARENAGKSTVSFELAKSLSEDGKKVLLLDGDLRKSDLVTRIQVNIKVDKGFTHYLSNQADISDIIYNSNKENLDIIFSGPPAPNPSELLGTKYFKEAISKLKEEYDYIIMDTPPVGAVIDAVIIAEKADGVIIIVETGKDQYGLVQEVKEQIKVTGKPILGAVLNKVEVSNGRYYGKYYGKYELGSDHE